MHSSSGCATSTRVRPSRNSKSALITEVKMLASRSAPFPPQAGQDILPSPMQHLRQEIERLFALGTDASNDRSALPTFHQFRDALTRGEIRSAEKDGERWATNVWVKQGI